MDAQFKFFGSQKITENSQPVMAGLNYFLTHEARGGSSKKLLGEKRDVRAWLAWLERRAHSEVEIIDTPIGYLPLYDDLKILFKYHCSQLKDRIFSQVDRFKDEHNSPEIAINRTQKNAFGFRQ